MIASLPMYWRPENAGAWQRFWDLVRAAADFDLPEITPPEALPKAWYDHWLLPDLVLSQTCGLPFRDKLKNRVTYVASIDYGLGCAPGYYYSVLVKRLDDDLERSALRLAFNAGDSQSGWAAAQPWLAAHPDARLMETGAHVASVEAVQDGRADAAHVDAVTWRVLENLGLTEDLEIAATTKPTPGLPLITSMGRDPAPIRQAVSTALGQLSDDDRTAMGGPRALVEIATAEYHALPVPAAPTAPLVA